MGCWNSGTRWGVAGWCDDVLEVGEEGVGQAVGTFQGWMERTWGFGLFGVFEIMGGEGEDEMKRVSSRWMDMGYWYTAW